MNKIRVTGGRTLEGEVRIGGSKNAALPVLFAGILTGDVCVFRNLPRVSDVLLTLEILRFLGARIRFYESGEVRVDYSDMRPLAPPATLTCGMRASVYLLGAMLGRFGRVTLTGAGGCDFGQRPIDLHLRGFSLLGAELQEDGAGLHLQAAAGLAGCEIELPLPSVGATVNLLLAATAADGETVIRGGAAEPHVAAVVAFLRAAGAPIEERDDGFAVRGGMPLHGCTFTVISDMIEAGTYLCAAMATGGCVRLLEAEPAHLTALLDVLREMGAAPVMEESSIFLRAPQYYRCVAVETGPYPAFPTDLHPQLAALFAIGGRAEGEGSIRETVWRERFRYTEGLAAMGADVRVEGDTVYLRPAALRGSRLVSPDLRGGAALLIAALAAEGESEISKASTIGRGYEHPEQKLRSLGANVKILS